MSTPNVFDSLIKQYSGLYKYTTTVRHKGTVIAFAMNDQQRIFYSVLNLNSTGDQNAADANNPQSAIDKDGWEDPKPLNFPTEIAEVGFGVADQTLLPSYRNNSQTPEKPGINLRPTEKDLFLSSTARLTADAPFQVLSDGQFVYLFRQAIANPATYATVDQQQAARRKMVFVQGTQLSVSPDGTGLVQFDKAQDAWVASSATGSVPIVNSTLLVDRFVLSGAYLQTKMEVRFQRSRSKTRPQSRKDSLGAKDLDGNDFLEPTQELKFLGNLTDGRFTVLLLPTQIQEIQRWQIFAHNSKTGLIDAFDVERSTDGLFNTRGSQVYTCVDHPNVFSLKSGKCAEPSLTDSSQVCNKDLVPRVVTEGYAESALRTKTSEELDAEVSNILAQKNLSNLQSQGKFSVITEPHVALASGVKLGQTFTQEAWILPTTSSTTSQALLTNKSNGNTDSLAASRQTHDGCPSIWIEAGSRVRIGFGDGNQWYEVATKSILTPNIWNHLAVTFDGNAYRVYVNGRLREKADMAQVYINGTLQQQLDAEGNSQPKLASLQGKTPVNSPITSFGAAKNTFRGTIDEIRLWSWARSEKELQADMHQRLVGQELKLVGYWRFDEATGKTIYDQTDNKANGTLQSQLQWSVTPFDAPPFTQNLDEWLWVNSDAPVGESLGVSRSSFQIASTNANGQLEARSITSGITALLYYQQENVASGYSNEEKPLKRNARVMLAVATKSASGDKNEIATLDLGVSGSGKLAQIPDVVPLSVIHKPNADGQSINQQLDKISSLQSQTRILKEEIINLDRLIDRTTPTVTILNNAIANPSIDSIIYPEFAYLNEKLRQLKTAQQDVTQKEGELAQKDAEVSNATAIFYQDTGFEGKRLSTTRGFLDTGVLESYGFNNLISSLKIPPQLQVTLYEDDNRGGSSRTFKGDVSSVGDFNDLTSSIDVVKNPDYTRPAEIALQTANDTLTARKNEVINERDLLQSRINAYTQEKNDKNTKLTTIQTELDSIRSGIIHGVDVPMKLVHTDPFGLTIAGGLLGFAWTKDTPFLFDSATGSLALYFRGIDDQFFVTYYTTQTERAKYPLTNAQGQDLVICFARSTDLEMDQIVITTSGNPNADICSVTITGANITETWNNVPRNPERFAKVLNGLAGEREFIGSGTIKTELGQVKSLEFADGLKRSLPKGATLIVGKTKVTTQERAEKNATKIAITSGIIPVPTEKLPVFFLEYDYTSDAQTTKVPNDLYNGSLLIRAMVDTTQSGQVQIEQRVTSGGTLTCKWTAASPGSTLAFDGVDDYVHLQNAQQLKQLDAASDVTIEAWMRPNRIQEKARILQHYSNDGANYALGLEAKELLSALEFIGSNYVELGQGVVLGDKFTQEAWIYPTDANADFNGFLGNHPEDSSKRSPSIWVFQNNHIHAGFGDGSNWNAFITNSIPNSQPVLSVNTWNHVAVTFDGEWYRLYVNAVLKYSTDAFKGKKPINTPVRFIGKVDNFFKGRIDDVRLWKQARTQAEIQADMNRQLRGNEIGLVGYWHFENRIATDYSRFGNDGTLRGDFLNNLPSPLPAYAIFAGVNNQFVQTSDIFAGGNWNHVAAAFDQSYGLEFDGTGGYLDCGNDTTLDISRDLTIEIFLQVKDLSRGNGILSRGKLNDGTTDHDVPYAVCVLPDGKIGFVFEDVKHQVHSFVSEGSIGTNFSKIGITRKRVSKETKDDKAVTGVKVESWDEIKFYINGALSGVRNYESQQPASDDFRQPTDIGNSSQSLEIGVGLTINLPVLLTNQEIALPIVAPLRGILTEIRIWNTARELEQISQEIKGSEKGLVSWWQFEENDGNTAFDSKSRNHAAIKGIVKWVKDPSPDGSKLTLYHNGSKVLAPRIDATALKTNKSQFTIGTLQTTNNPTQFFQGELEELRIWKITRTEEQIQDNLFRRLMGEQENLLAYYTFDPDVSATSSTAITKLDDRSSHGNHLDITGAAYILSTAPIGEDIPQVRSALAGVKTTFHDLIQSPPSIQEYGDLQYDSAGNLIGIFKRCYSFLKDGQWQLVTGFKVGDLITEWIGQMQTAPQLIGYIEGAPPVPSENLAATGYVLGEFSDYTGASSVELTKAQSTTYTYSASKDQGFDMSVDLKVGPVLGLELESGIGLAIETVDVENVIGLHANFENSLSWLEDASTGVGRTTTEATKMELRGIVENADAIAYPKIGRRFVPDNMGMALVKSETADIFALRLKHNNALISFQMRPNPDIPPDRNIITFPMNPRYVKQGTLDGKIGFEADPDYPQALTYSSDTSYFKPIEAYALKERINRQEAELQTYYEQYAAGAKGRRQDGLYGSDSDLAVGRAVNKLPRLQKRNLVNSYVWTAAGGLYAETQETMDVYQEQLGGAYAFKGTAGIYTDLTLAIGGAGIKFELDAMFGGHLNLTVTKSQESQTAFGLNVDLGKVESDIYLRNEKGELVMDDPDPRKAKPRLRPERVDAYRFMTFYLEPRADQFDLFFNRVVDPIWLAQSDDPSALALREAQQNKNDTWRIMHRVTYVSRILPSLSEPAPSSLEKTLQTLDIDSNYELIKQLEPFVANKLTSYVEFTDAIRDTIRLYFPELQPHEQAVMQYMSLYFGIVDGQDQTLDDAQFGQASLRDRPLNQPPIVNAGTDQIIGLDDSSTSIELEGSVIDDRLEKSSAIFVTWEQIAGEGTVVFDDPHALKTTATFTKRGKYLLRLTAEDGMLSASDNLTIVVNQRPVISAGGNKQVVPTGQNTRQLKTLLQGVLIDSGLGDPDRGVISVKWSNQSRGTVTFENAKALQTSATFDQSGNYLLKLTVDNGTFTVDNEVTIAVAARATQKLQALYTFESSNGVVPDVSGGDAPLNLVVTDANHVQKVAGGLLLKSPTLLATSNGAGKITTDVQSTNEITIEAWLQSSSGNSEGLARIVTFSEGAGKRNFTLGQTGDRFYIGIRTTTTNDNASNKPLAVGKVTTAQLTHIVATREASGVLRFFQDGQEISRRELSGNFSNWNNNFKLALGNELGSNSSDERAWLGQLHLVAIYSRALTADEVRQNYEFGADTNLPPVISAGEDQVIDWAQTQPLPIVAQLTGRITHDRPSPNAITRWSQIAGPGSPNGVKFGDEKALVTSTEFTRNGRYVLRLTVDDGELMSSDEVVVVVNQPPTIAAQVAPFVTLLENSVTTQLTGIIKNEGLGELSDSIRITWRRVSGPNTMQIANANQLNAIATLTERGVYQLEFKVDNGRLSQTIPVVVTVNQSPSVSAGTVPVLTLPLLSEVNNDPTAVKVQTTLAGQIINSGLGNPQQNNLTVKWQQVSGPGEIKFADDTKADTQATFTVGGIYVLRFSATNPDSDLSSFSQVSVTVNQRPIVKVIAAAKEITLPAKLELDATVSDDGLPTVPGILTLKWTKVSGPGNVNFADVNSSFTTASFSKGGNYVLRLTANDGAVEEMDEVAIAVKSPPRIANNLVLLYTFKENGGNIVTDVSGIDPALNLTFAGDGAKLQGGVLSITKPTLVASAAAATKLIRNVKATNAITIEAWVKPRDINPTQQLPARIVTVSRNEAFRNFTLGQENGYYVIRLRTTVADANGTNNAFPVGRVSTSQVSHLVYTWDKASKIANFYLDGEKIASQPNIDGDFAVWADDFRLGLGNEFNNQSRAWLGNIHLVAIYNQALSISEVRQNFNAGLDTL
ncbi:hypothetical protein NIES22_72310 (plasmid) [Calothrix brevissima NIES-22]|nr:hypothetical protein NIES22_72310 [Calothrix brevissima NIES-22]